MSTTQPPNTDDHVSSQRAFDQLIWYNAEICCGCFEHVKDVDETRLTRGRTEPLDVQDHYRTETATLEQDSEIVDDYGELESVVPRTTCETCGRIGCWADDDTLSKIQALRLVGPLAHRLREQGLEFDKAALRKAVRLFKERDDVQGYDTEIFRRSVELAAQRG